MFSNRVTPTQHFRMYQFYYIISLVTTVWQIYRTDGTHTVFIKTPDEEHIETGGATSFCRQISDPKNLLQGYVSFPWCELSIHKSPVPQTAICQCLADKLIHQIQISSLKQTLINQLP